MTKLKDLDSSCKCLDLALEAERLCKTTDPERMDKAISIFKTALKLGTNDPRMLSAIYSQLGNAYFHKKDYQEALKYHKLDLQLSQLNNDQTGEAKSCGNLGNTYKMLEEFEEAVYYCEQYLKITRQLKDQIGESRALYNLGKF